MNILFTGGSSFTGFWFARELAAAGHRVTVTLRQAPDAYTDAIRLRRVSELVKVCTPALGASFGDEGFMRLLADQPWDVVCHHGADVTNYKSPDFDSVAAARNNTLNIAGVMQRAAAAGCRRFVLTGSVFENDEGAGSEGLPAFSAYGLSKALSWQLARYYALRTGLSIGKFVIPNPFGAYEEPRFTAYLMKNWMAGKPAGVNTPDYVRDNIHVALLARCYRRFVETLPATPGVSRLNPSGYAESQGAFATRLAAQMRTRLGVPCELQLARQTDFSEPRVRINTDVAAQLFPEWNEDGAWDEFAAFYTQPARS